MDLCVRADADSKMGTGHIMRCIALAQRWQDQGGTVTFISHCESNAIRERIGQEGFKFVAIENPHPHADDLAQTIEYLKQPSVAWLVLDGYHFTPVYQMSIRNAGIRLLVIDDMNHLPDYQADILLNQNINPRELIYHHNEDTKMLLGTRYVLLRREFLNYRNLKRQIPKRAGKILVILGGADPDNATRRVVEALKLLNDSEIEVKIVIGPANAHREKLLKELPITDLNAEFLIDPPNMPELMAWADIAVSAGGSTCWELAFMGLPSIITIMAENQRLLVAHIAGQQAAISLGSSQKFSDEQLCEKIKSLIYDQALRETLSKNASSLIDGQGSLRVVEVMTGRLITLRKVIHDDCELIWQWSNENETRKASYSIEPISWDEHVGWFRKKLADPHHVFFIALDGKDKPIGQIRYTIDDKIAIVSLSIASDSRNQGYGSELLSIAANRLFQEKKVEEISAYIKSGNPVSLKTFQKAGFMPAEELSLWGVKSQKYILRKRPHALCY
jgi:UDP-2,4-diacetamido-2,4,6-trideoxy-beta-L-altropyranose hydrolase